jgi:hypothetical protein
MVNAAVEEGAYRGVILHALDRSLGPGFAALLLQALAFGAIHIRGFPRGWIGVGLACIYGLLMGVIRRRAGGMFAPWIAHVFTDVVIAGILVFLARPNQALQPRVQTASFFRMSSVASVSEKAATCFSGAAAELVLVRSRVCVRRLPKFCCVPIQCGATCSQGDFRTPREFIPKLSRLRFIF